MLSILYPLSLSLFPLRIPIHCLLFARSRREEEEEDSVSDATESGFFPPFGRAVNASLPSPSNVKIQDTSPLLCDTASTSPMLIGEDRFSSKRLHGLAASRSFDRSFGIPVSRKRRSKPVVTRKSFARWWTGCRGERRSCTVSRRGIADSSIVEITKMKNRGRKCLKYHAPPHLSNSPFACRNVIKRVFDHRAKCANAPSAYIYLSFSIYIYIYSHIIYITGCTKRMNECCE